MKIVLQDGAKDCGICCILSIIRFYGGDVSKEYLRELTCTNKSGVSAYSMIETMKLIGFDAYGVNGDLENIGVDDLPCIAHVVINKKVKHFVVIYEIDNVKQKVILMDPADGKKSMSFSEFKLITSFNFIFCTPVKKLPIMLSHNKVKRVVVELLKKEVGVIALLIMLTNIYFVLQIIVAFHFKFLLEFSIKYTISNLIIIISIFLVITYIFKEFCNFLKNILMMKLLSKFDFMITFKVYEQILLLPYLYFKNRTTGEVLQRFKDLSVIKNFIAMVCSSFIPNVVSMLLFFFFLLRINKTLSFIMLIICFLLFINIIIFCKFRKQKIKNSKVAEDNVNSFFVESLSNIETIKNSHTEKRIIDIFMLKYKKLLEEVYSVFSVSEFLTFTKNFFNDFIMVIILGVGSYFVIDKRIVLSEIIVYQTLFGYFLSSFYSLIDIFNYYGEYRLSINRIEDMFIIKPEVFIGNYYMNLKLDGDIVFDNFSYLVNGKELFKNLSFVINRHDKVLLVGKSGSGKSTLMKILVRYIDVDYGNVFINDIDISHYHLDIIRRNITYVSSNEQLFTNTIYNNITLGKDIDWDRFKFITKSCCVDEIINVGNLNYNSIIEENGFNLSSGERQRIILARALLRNSDIYIFDEAFGQIDSERRKIILKNVFEYLNDKTVIVVSHNIENSKLFNKFYRLEDGKIYDAK